VNRRRPGGVQPVAGGCHAAPPFSASPHRAYFGARPSWPSECVAHRSVAACTRMCGGRKWLSPAAVNSRRHGIMPVESRDKLNPPPGVLAREFQACGPGLAAPHAARFTRRSVAHSNAARIQGELILVSDNVVMKLASWQGGAAVTHARAGSPAPARQAPRPGAAVTAGLLEVLHQLEAGPPGYQAAIAACRTSFAVEKQLKSMRHDVS
jgi:hypothetical protein